MNKIGKIDTTLLVHASAGDREAEKLLPGQVKALERVRGKRLECTSGRLWVTFENEGDDHILEANQGLDIREKGLVVISALNSGAYKVA